MHQQNYHKMASHDISKLKYFRKQLCRNRTGRFEGTGNTFFICDEKCVASLDSSSLGDVRTYYFSSSFESTLLVEQAEAHLKYQKTVSRFRKGVTEEEVVRKVSNNGILKARVSH